MMLRLTALKFVIQPSIQVDELAAIKVEVTYL
jgi:hypothetical protein